MVTEVEFKRIDRRPSQTGVPGCVVARGKAARIADEADCKADPEVAKALPTAELDFHLKGVETNFLRVFGEAATESKRPLRRAAL